MIGPRRRKERGRLSSAPLIVQHGIKVMQSPLSRPLTPRSPLEAPGRGGNAPARKEESDGVIQDNGVEFVKMIQIIAAIYGAINALIATAKMMKWILDKLKAHHYRPAPHKRKRKK